MENINADQVPHYIKDLDYPARKKDILDEATRNEADEKVIKALKALADDQVFESPMEISRAVAEASDQ